MSIRRIPSVVTVTRQGLAPTLSGVSTQYLDGTGVFSTVSTGSGIQNKNITFVLSNSGSVLTTGYKTAIRVFDTSTITTIALLSNDPASTIGNLVLDVLSGTTFPPSTSIVAAAPPTLTATNNTTDATLTGWTTAIPSGSFIGVSVTSVTTIIQGALQIAITVP